ncbi:MAG: BON domain-containing protein [Massilia sp.]
MKLTLLATLLTAASASFAAAPTASLNHDPATYRNVTQKAAADYKAASAQCASQSGNAKDICTEEAKAARAHAEADAVAQYNNTTQGQLKARTTVANADYALAKAKCGSLSGADKDNCLNTAQAARTAALADAKAGRAATTTSVAADGSADVATPIASTATRDATKAAAVDKCAQIAGQPNTGCLIDNKTANNATTPSGATVIGSGTVANRTEATVDTAGEKTRNAAATVAEKTRNAASTAVQKTSEVASKAAEKTREIASGAAAKTDRATDNMGDKTEVATAKTGAVVADSVITTKVKADLFKEPELKSLGIHVETEKGVVMLSGFVDKKANADKAVSLAKSVEGVQSVKSAINVK